MPLIYHITHMSNLQSIINAGGLHCHAIMCEGRVNHTNIGHQNIKEKRSYRPVRKLDPPFRVVGAGGTLADYVPLYFAPRSPMLYSINGGYVEGYSNGQRDVLHLVCSVEDIVNQGLPFAFTDGHGIMELTDFYDDIEDLCHIDWNVMASRMWCDTDENPDRKRRRQAEFLVHHFLPWHFINEIGVIDRSVQEEVQNVLAVVEHQPAVAVHREWYY